MMKKIMLALLLLLALTAAAFGGMAEEDPVLASAYGGEIELHLSELQADFDAALEMYLYQYAQYGYAVDEYDTSFQTAVAQEVIYVAMSERIVTRHAEQQGYVLTPEREAEISASVQSSIDQAREYYESYLSYYGFFGDELNTIVEEELAAAGFTYDALMESAKLEDLIAFLTDIAIRDVTITEDEVVAAFNAKVEAAKANYANPDNFINDYLSGADILYTPAGMRIVQSIYIMPDVEEIATDAEATEIADMRGREKADAIHAQILAGASYEELMAAYNEDGATAEQMMMGYPVHADGVLYSESFQTAAMALENIGDVSGVVETEQGFYILRYAGDLTEGAVDFEPRKEAETAEALAAKQEAAFSAYLDGVLEESAVELKDITLLFHVYVSEVIEPTVAYAAVTAETALTDMPAGDTMATLSVGATLDILGRIGMDGEEYVFVSVPGTELMGYVDVKAIADTDEAAALAADNAALTVKTEAPDKNPTFTIAMNNGGVIYGELYPESAPQTVGNFVELAGKNFYDGLIFHRVISGFMIQGGDPLGNGTGGPGYAIKGEFSANGVENGLAHTRGVLSMARSSAMDSAGCQFFIMHADASHLDGQYAAFGMVLGGIENVDVIAAVDTDASDRPRTEQKMRKVYVETYGKSYEFTKLDD